jgi:HAE1 family hydrophobic/amphiphilic exporter-1
MIEIFIHRKVTTAMVFLGICLLGIISFSRLPVRLLPEIEFPRLTVVTPFENATPTEIEKLVTRRVEEAVGSVNGVTDVYSESIEGLSMVTARFRWGIDMNFAMVETKEKVDIIKGQLPQDAGSSIVVKYDPSEEPVMIYAVTPRSGDFKNIRKRIEKEIVPLLERTEGVSLVHLNGGWHRQVNIDLDCGKIFSHNLSLSEVIERVGLANYNFPAGSIERGDMEYTIRTVGEFSGIDEMKHVVVGRNDSGTSVFLGSIADIEDGYRDRKCVVRTDGKESVGVLLHKEPDRNTVDTCGEIRTRMAAIQKRHGNDLRISSIYDQSEFIRNSINGVFHAALIGGVIALLVLWFFLGEQRPAFIIAASIPVSVLGTFALMYFTGLSINVMSLGGLALGVGMMVDGGIVVLESISGTREAASGDTPAVASAITGVREVLRSVIASTITSLVVFLPILFLSGLTGALFGELALTISFALLCSLATSLGLIPMLSTVNPGILSRNKNFGKHIAAIDHRAAQWSGAFMERLTGVYEEALRSCIAHRKNVLRGGGALVIAGILITLLPDRELMPSVDRGEFTIAITAPRGTALSESLVLCRNAEAIVGRNQFVAHVHSKTGSDPEENITERMSGRFSNYSIIRVILKKGRNVHVRRIMAELKEKIRFGPMVKVEFRSREDIVQTVLGSGEKPVSIEITGSDLERLRGIGGVIKGRLEKSGALSSVESLLDRGNPELKILVDRPRMASLGVNIAGIASAIRAAVHGEAATTFREKDDDIDVRVRLRRGDVRDRDSLGSILVKNENGATIPIGKFITIAEGTGPGKIVRSGQGRVNVISAEVNGSSSAAFRDIQRILASLRPGEGYTAKLKGRYHELMNTIPEMIFVLILAIVLVYMVLASQFQSLTLPLIIMCSIPLTLVGSSGALLLTGMTLNINSGIGMVLLVGTVVNSAIVLIDYINISRTPGANLRDAVMHAGKRRLRPILMTTATTIFAMLPIALGIGEGSELQQPLAVATIGGLFVSTVLTLVFIPVLYLWAEERRQR